MQKGYTGHKCVQFLKFLIWIEALHLQSLKPAMTTKSVPFNLFCCSLSCHPCVAPPSCVLSLLDFVVVVLHPVMSCICELGFRMHDLRHKVSG